MREGARALGGVLDLQERLLDLVGDLQHEPGELHVAHDHGEQVVEVVRHPAGESPDRLEPLGLVELRLQIHLLLFALACAR